MTTIGLCGFSPVSKLRILCQKEKRLLQQEEPELTHQLILLPYGVLQNEIRTTANKTKSDNESSRFQFCLYLGNFIYFDPNRPVI